MFRPRAGSGNSTDDTTDSGTEVEVRMRSNSNVGRKSRSRSFISSVVAHLPGLRKRK